MSEKIVKSILAVLIFSLFAWVMLLTEPMTAGQTYNNTSLVNTTVNITNAAPYVYNIVIPSSIDLTAYDNITVQCNFTVSDYDNNTIGANATLHFSSTPATNPPDQNNLYQNSSCTRVSPFDFDTNFTCTFSVNYFANNGTWYCNATGIDLRNATGNNQSNGGIINPLVALKMDELLDFGQLGVGDISNDTLANITNVGNRNINISVEGWGNTQGDGLAMDCTFGSISVGYERYDTINGTAYGFMTPLTSAYAMITNFYVPQRTNEALESINSTYWKLEIPSGAGGLCEGKILFSAIDRGN